MSTSTTEAELLSLLHAGKQAIWWHNLFVKLKFDTGHPLTIYNDNMQTIRLLNSESPVIATKLRHIDISQHWLRERVQNGDIHVKWVETSKMIADGLTKLMPPQKHQQFVRMLGLVDIKNRIQQL